MSELLQQALDIVRRLPSERQDNIARMMLRLAEGENNPEQIERDDLPAVLGGLAQARAGEFATEQEVEAALRCSD